MQDKIYLTPLESYDITIKADCGDVITYNSVQFLKFIESSYLLEFACDNKDYGLYDSLWLYPNEIIKAIPLND